MTFALPLSLGMESLCESMDIRIEGDSTNEEIFAMLKGSMPPGIELICVDEPVHDQKHIAFGEFDIFFDCAKGTKDVVELINSCLEGDELIVQKLGKKGRHKVLKDINLIEFVKSYTVGTFMDRVKLTIVLPAGSTTNVNPSILADEIVKRHTGELSYTIVRKALHLENMEKFQ